MSENKKIVVEEMEEKVDETKKKGFSLSAQDHEYVEKWLEDGKKRGYGQSEYLMLAVRKLKETQDGVVVNLEPEKKSINRHLSAISLVLEQIFLKVQDVVQESRDFDALELSGLELQIKEYKEKVLKLSDEKSILEKENAQVKSELNFQLKLKESRIDELEKMIGLLQQTNDEKEKVIELLQQKSDEKDKMLEEVNARFQEEKAEKEKVLQEEKAERIKLQEQLVGLVKEKMK